MFSPKHGLLDRALDYAGGTECWIIIIQIEDCLKECGIGRVFSKNGNHISPIIRYICFLNLT